MLPFCATASLLSSAAGADSSPAGPGQAGLLDSVPLPSAHARIPSTCSSSAACSYHVAPRLTAPRLPTASRVCSSCLLGPTESFSTGSCGHFFSQSLPPPNKYTLAGSRGPVGISSRASASQRQCQSQKTPPPAQPPIRVAFLVLQGATHALLPPSKSLAEMVRNPRAHNPWRTVQNSSLHVDMEPLACFHT